MNENVQRGQPPDPWQKDERFENEPAGDFRDPDRRRDDYGYPDVGLRSRPLAERGERLGAAIIDGLVGRVCFVPGLVCIFIALGSSDIDGSGTRRGESNIGLLMAGIVLLLLFGLSLMVYQIVLLTKHGQTIGKRAMNVRIVKFEDNTNPGFVGAFLLRSFVPGLISNIPYIGGLFGLVDILFIFREDRRCIHDLIAGTKVVEA